MLAAAEAPLDIMTNRQMSADSFICLFIMNIVQSTHTKCT